MKVLRKTSGAKIALHAALLLALFIPLAALAACSQPPPAFVAYNLGIPAAALQSAVVGPLPDATELNVGITYKIDPKTLNVVGQQPLRPGQSSDLERFAKSLGISDATAQKIENFFNAQGLVLKLSKLRTYQSLQGKASTFARLLQTKFVIHKYNGRQFYAPSTAPKIPSFMAGQVAAITGLDNYSAHPVPSFQMTLRGPHASNSGELNCNPGDQTLLTPADVAQAYGYDTLYQRGVHGENMSINLVEIDGSYVDDVQNYLDCIHYHGHFSVYNVDGKPSDVQGESTLDIEMAAGLAPSANINLYQTDGNANGDTWVQVNDELQQIIDANTNNASTGSVVSVSLGIDEGSMTSSDVNALDSSLRQLTQVEHMTVFVASGDCGAFASGTFLDLSVSFPASDPWAVAVGGTKLSLTAQGTRSNEVTWSHFPNVFHCGNNWGSGGGNSSMYARPAWQSASGVNNQKSHNDRQIPDVAAVAENLAVYFNGGWGAVGGTSAAAPIWAAGQALLNEDTIKQRGSFAYSPRLYYEVADAHGGSNAYYDVTYGNNLYYTATAGWDFTSGLGTPNLGNFDQAVSIILATANGGGS